MPEQESDICLILEGTYPYVAGGVSTWTHDLILNQPDMSFHIVAISAAGAKLKKAYEMPKNVIGITDVTLQHISKESRSFRARKLNNFYRSIEGPLLNIQTHAKQRHFKKLIEALGALGFKPGSETLLDSHEAWMMLTRMYRANMYSTCFLDYFWSWRALMGGLFSLILAPLPKAKCYHALSTGYAGLYMARAGIESGKPCMITEHGIYTNERRIEILLADWLFDAHSLNYNLEKDYMDRTLQDFWIDTFRGYSKVAYETADVIVTLYSGNQEFQIADGAAPEKLKVIPNGIDYGKFSAVKRDADHPPTVALIGRVVPIKDVKTYIRAIALLRESVPNIKAMVMGPTDEDKEYFEECLVMQKKLEVEDILEFTGPVQLTEYLGKIDINVLTSLSEAQPLVILEAGAAGVVSVATNVGSCEELILGKPDEDPPIGPGGAVCPLANPRAIADALADLLKDGKRLEAARAAIQTRTEQHYNRIDQHQSYKELYDGLLSKADNLEKEES